MKALAPGKVILSGEHAVVYGRPALVAGVGRFAAVDVNAGCGPLLRVRSPFGCTEVPDAAAVAERVAAVRRRYAAFLADELPIVDVLPDQHALVELAWDRLHPDALPNADGLDITIDSDLPVGAGMGSSAAVAAALVTALSAFYRIPLTPAGAFDLCWELERFQHGRPSGVDPFVAVHGGLVRYRRGEDPAPASATLDELRLWHTGVPDCGTGECVSQVRTTHGQSSIWDDFEAVCRSVEEAVRGRDESALRAAVRRNHRLLVRIGVVPDRVRALVESVERQGGAAKICGAGAVRGHAGGVLWVVGPAELPDRAGEELRVSLETRGARLAG